MEDVVLMSDEEFFASEENDSGVEETDNQEQNGNPQLADALAKVIRMAKNKNGKSIVLSKAKLYSPTVVSQKAHGFEIEPDPNIKVKEEEVDVKVDVEDVKPSERKLRKLKLSRQEKLQRGRVKPSPLDREKERPLVKIATRGVVQLFNAVRQQQSAINKQINQPNITETKKEKILKSIDKKAFLDVLMGKNKTSSDVCKKEEEESNINSNEIKVENEEPSWQVLRDDFMMGAKLKDWDKKEIRPMEEED